MEPYRLKVVTFFNREVPIVLQNQNGPCPLLAIANILLLRGSAAACAGVGCLMAIKCEAHVQARYGCPLVPQTSAR